jgi:hypothetical protein
MKVLLSELLKVQKEFPESRIYRTSFLCRELTEHTEVVFEQKPDVVNFIP